MVDDAPTRPRISSADRDCAVVVVLTIVVTGNDFIFDALAGMLVMWVGIVAAERLPARRDGAILEPATRGGAVR